jgi:hypothetical protein
MALNDVKCEAIAVKTDSGVCPGIAETKQGEVFIIGPRTPAPNGICCQAFSALASLKLVMMYTGEQDLKKDYFDIVCPHGFVTYRLSREIDKAKETHN